MINKDNNLNIDILRQQNANIPLQEASSQSEEPHQLENSKSEGNFHNSASKDNNIGAMLKKDVEKLSTLVSECSPRNEDWKCHSLELNARIIANVNPITLELTVRTRGENKIFIL